METVGAYEAKTHLPSLLEKVTRGEKITITKHGVPIAMIVPVEGAVKPDVNSTVEAIREFRRGRKLKGISIREMIEEGRRF